MKKPKVLILDEDANLHRALARELKTFGVEVLALVHVNSALQVMKRELPELAILGSVSDGKQHGVELAERIRGLSSTLPIILLARKSSEETAITAIKTRVSDYFKDPLSAAEIGKSVMRCLSRRVPQPARVDSETQGSETSSPNPIVGVSTQIRRVRSSLERIAAADSTVLITGETGTGKELVAELIHHLSARNAGPFVRFNCAAIPDSLFESELFGHEKGAFTGAAGAREGVLRRAAGGTVLLDEIGDMSRFAQAKVLRAIENKEIQQLGRSGNVRLDIRILAATNQDLECLVSECNFRKDLYFRLNIVRVHLPPLRERREDIPFLLKHFVGAFNRRFKRKVRDFDDDAIQQLMHYDWPGNVRELRNIVEAAFVAGAEHTVSSSLLAADVRGGAATTVVSERELVIRTLRSTQWNKSKAAKKLHWSRMTLYRKLAKYGIERTRRDSSEESRPRASHTVTL